MNNVIDFPIKAAQDKSVLEKSIKDFLDYATDDQQAKRELTARLLSIFETYQHDYSFDFDIECPPSITKSQAYIIEESVKENFRRFEEQIHIHMNTILLERFQKEVELYFFKCGDDCLLVQ